MIAIICDIDGTIANLAHRLHYVKNGKRDWDNFFKEVKHDAPYDDTIHLLHSLRSTYMIIFVSGRTPLLNLKFWIRYLNKVIL